MSMFGLSYENITKLERKIENEAKSKYFYITFCIASFCAALLEGLLITQSGQNMGPVAVTYIFQGAQIYSGSVFEILSHMWGGLPPLYSILIAAFMHLGLTAENAARIITVSFFALSMFPIFFLGRLISGYFTAYLACLTSLVFTPFLYVTSYAWAETAYIFSSLMAILLITIFYQNNKNYILYASAIFVSLAALLRYNGVILFLTCLITLLIVARPIKNYLYNISIFSCISLIPLSLWFFMKDRQIRYFATRAFADPEWVQPIVSNQNGIVQNIDLTIRTISNAFFKIALTSENGLYIAVIIVVFCSILFILNKNMSSKYLRKNYIPILYMLLYSSSMIVMCSVYAFDPIGDRFISPVYPFIILTSISFIHIIFNQIKIPSIKRGIILAISILLIIFFIIQINSSVAFYKQTKSYHDSEQLGSDRLNSYILKYNITSNDTIYINGNQFSYPKLALMSNERNSNIKLGYISKASPNETILENLTSITGPVSARSLADLIRANKNSSIYLIAPLEVAQNYMNQPPKDICFINPFRFSKSFICIVDLKNNGTCIINQFPRDYLIDNRSSIKTALAGNFIGQKHDQLLILKSNPNSAKENNLQILDFTKGSPVRVEYDDMPGTTWLNANHSLLSGDFMGLGYDQAFDINGDKIVIEDFSQGKAPAIVRYSDVLANNSALQNLPDSEDAQFAGDFLGRGYSQVLFVNRKARGGKLVIADFSKGKTPEMTEISEIEGNSTRLRLMLDAGDRQFSGDFMGLGYSQLLMINYCTYTKAKEPKIIIADFSKGKKSASLRYLENWGESTKLDGWLGVNDTQLVGDFMGLGHSQLLFVNHDPGEGKIMIADFIQDKPPAAIKYYQGTLFQGWPNINDTRIAGDFKERGYSQVLSLNNNINGSNATIVEFINGKSMIAL